MREYNLQPLSPRMIRKPPMNDFSLAASASLNNIGSPAGLMPEGKLAILDARLREIQGQAARDNQMRLAELSAEALRNQAGAAMAGDSANIQGATAQAQLDTEQGAHNGTLDTIANALSVGVGAGQLMQGLERLTAARDENGMLDVASGGKEYNTRGGAVGGAVNWFANQVSRGLGSVIPRYGQARSSAMEVAAERQNTAREIQLRKKADQERTAELVGIYNDMTTAYQNGFTPLALALQQYNQSYQELLGWLTNGGGE